jgi:dienelactone hydrolase
VNPQPATRRNFLRDTALAAAATAAWPLQDHSAWGNPAGKVAFDRILEPQQAWHQLWLQAEAHRLRSNDRTPESAEEWADRKTQIREALRRSFGQFPERPTELNPKILGRIERDGFSIERLLFQTRPNVWVPANAYVPDERQGKLPAVLCVHGHWPGARIDPHVQARCLGLVKLGYFVLAIDAFSAGERSLDPQQPMYHGAMFGAGLWPAGIPLLGLQLYDNIRAADYLQSRSEIDPDRLAITGASGGGNQTMYAGAFDERFKAVVPVCSVGTFQSYLSTANCVGETLIAGLSYTEEGHLLALTAPRALMVINATQDALCFSVEEAAKSIAAAKPIFKLLKAEDRIRHVIVDSKHDYNQPMREAMYGWLDRWLRQRGDGSPVPEPPIDTEELDTLRCFPDGLRPKTFHLLPAVMHAAARDKANAIATPASPQQWAEQANAMRAKLLADVLGPFPSRSPFNEAFLAEDEILAHRRTAFRFDAEPNMPIPGWWLDAGDRKADLRLVVAVHPEGKSAALKEELVIQLARKPCHLLLLDLRSTGETASPIDPLGSCPDHNSARWSIWIGRPLVAQWAWDLIRTIEFAKLATQRPNAPVHLIGFAEAGLAALVTPITDDRVATVTATGTLAGYVTPAPFERQRMAAMIPDILSAGDIPHLAALRAPQRLAFLNPVDAQAAPLSTDQANASFAFTRHIYDLQGASPKLKIGPAAPTGELADWILA